MEKNVIENLPLIEAKIEPFFIHHQVFWTFNGFYALINVKNKLYRDTQLE